MPIEKLVRQNGNFVLYYGLRDTVVTPPAPVSDPLVPAFTYTQGTDADSYRLDVDASTSTGPIASYIVDFGNGAIVTKSTPGFSKFYYIAAGTYNVKLQLVGTDGTKSSVVSQNVTVVDPPATNPPSGGGTGGSRANLVPGAYKPDKTTTGLLPGWTKSQLTQINANSPGVQQGGNGGGGGYNSGAYWPAFIPSSNTTYENVWFHIPVWVPAGRSGIVFRNCLFDGFGIKNMIEKTASNYQAPHNGAVDWACLDFTAVGVSGAAGNNKNAVIIEDCEISPYATNDSVNGIRGCGYTLRRTLIHNVVDGIDLFRNGSNEQLGVLIEASYVTDLIYYNTVGNHGDNRTHNDGLQWAGGTGWEMNGARLEALGPAVGTMGSDQAPAYPVVGNTMSCTSNAGPATGMNVHNSWFDGGFHDFIAIVTSNTATRTNLGSMNNNKFGSKTKQDPIQISHYMSLSASGNTRESDGSNVPVTMNGTGAEY